MKKLLAFLWIAGCGFSQAPERPPGLYAVFNTELGPITAKLLEKDVPRTVRNFVELAQGIKAWREPKTGAFVKRPLYVNVIFHRTLSGVMIQTGDPTGKGTHDCGVSIRDEFLPGIRFDGPGRLAMATAGTPDSGGCQFFLTAQAMPTWNGQYTIFGQVVDGSKLVDKISRAPARSERPIAPVKLLGVTIERVGPEPKLKPRKD